MNADLPKMPEKDDADGQMRWRHQMRAILLAQRKEITRSDHDRASQAIRDHVGQLLAIRPAATIGFYWPFRGEIDLRPVLSAHIAAGGNAALPVVAGKDAPMAFHRWASETVMKPGYAGILEPVESPVVMPQVIIAPLVGFDDAGYRLGYGGGFFDRTLATLPRKPLVIGVGFAHSRVATIFPHRHDIPMDIVVTENGTREFSDAARGAEDRIVSSSPPCFLL
ncbi:5-formyltetrahydrofolate cyclo-ligase [Thalassospira sp.]|uniref:5-formyltetrahydrofolate cyclo-ligase n=1 Tax=Thalassospira sp. TaxID=1912094 RepID=UPI0027326015|nr:5-formyltetrahydrofolate cyclo-ligase [Thalassospira sp.]MDP2697450.1 5-formyltetrahydrofolate cyclo-ligase [Thalassospira sp.]